MAANYFGILFMETISKHFKTATIPPFVFAVILGTILIATHDGSSYKSEWFTNDGFAETVFLTFILSGLITLLSSTIFFNKITKIGKNILTSFISWTLLPGILCFFVIYLEIHNFSGGSDIDGYYEGNRLLDGYIMTVAIMHLIFLVASFIRFRRTQST